MAIADKLTELQATKTAIKTAIESKGQDLSGVPFTEYANKIDAISVGSESNPVPLTVTENGVYENEQGFSPVTVDVYSVAKLLNEKKGKHISDFFNGAANLTDEELEGIFSNVDSNFAPTETTGLFSNCKSITKVPLFDTSNVTNMYDMFGFCIKVVDIPTFNTSNVTNMSNMFRHCEQLQSIPPFNTSNVTNMGGMCNGCWQLTAVPALDMRNVTQTGNMLGACAKLTICDVKNINANFQVGSGYSWGHLLTQESALYLCKECRKSIKNARTITFATPVYDYLETLYVKLIPITDEMRAEDDLIDEKLPFEVCESTDEGAKSLALYMLSKNWTIAK